jgi:phage terminase large subunit GpA-like protein
MTNTHSPYITSPEGLAALGSAFNHAIRLYRPPDALTLSEWSDRFAFIPKESGAFPGKFQTSFAEYQRGIQDAITDPEIETIALMMCAQSGKTQIQLNTVGYYSHWEPSPILFVQASLSEAEKFSKNRVAKMIRDTPVLKKLFPSPRSRDSGNTLLNKEFLGGVLVMAGSNAPAGLSSMPIRIVEMDEVDRWEESAGTEGDPADLAKKRTQTFWNRKIIMASTPAIKNLSRIEKAYDSSDKRRYYVPCPHCGEMQVLEWKRLQWKTEPTAATARPRVIEWHYVCTQGCIIEESEKFEMIRRGEWRATSESHDGKTAGFQLNALYSPVVDWLKLIHEWLEAQTSLERMKVFVNTNLAETWEIRGTGANMTELEKRQRFQRDVLPSGVLWLTAGVDTQDNRLECTVWGWGLDDERWAIEHKAFPGDPSLPDTDPASPWAALRTYLLEEWEHRSGVTMRIATALIDSGGHHTERVYEFTRKHELRRWHAIMGRAGIGKPLLSSGSRVGPYKSLLYTVGVDTAKEDVFTSLRIHNSAQGGPGYTHFSNTLDSEYFRQLTAEKLVKTTRDFNTTMQWVKTSERNEALDCAVYARAAVSVRRPNFRKIARSLFRAAEKLRLEREAAGMPAPAPTEEYIGSATPTDCHPERPEGVEGSAVVSSPSPVPSKPSKPIPVRRRPSAAARLRNFGRTL